MKQFNARNMFLSNIKTCNKKKKYIEIIKKIRNIKIMITKIRIIK